MAGLDPISNLATLANTVLSRVLPDKQAQEQAAAQLSMMQLSGELAQIAGQETTDNTEAASKSIFVAGWRPFIGWVCGAGVAYEMIIRPLLSFTVALFGAHWQAPAIETQDLIGLLTGLLGLAGMRTVEKVQGVSSGH
jgi:Holin of 3TMs, for gene-transfer release